MSFQILYVLAVVAVVLVLFILERFPIEQVALAVPVALLAGGILTPEEAVSGFSNPATVTVAAMLVLSLGLLETGAVGALGRWIRAVTPGGPTMHLVALCVIVGVVSPFLNNTAVVAVFLPLFLALAKESKEAPSLYLMPLSFAAILGGTVTLIGTSTNLVVHEMALGRGFDELGMFSIAPLGLLYLAVGLTYLFTVGRWLLPDRGRIADLQGKYDVRKFVAELRVERATGAAGTPVRDLGWDEKHRVVVLGLHRDDRSVWGPWHRSVLRPGDVVYVQGDAESLLALAEKEGLVAVAGEGHEPDLSDDHALLAEALVTPASPFVGRTAREVGLAGRYGVNVLGLQREGAVRGGRLAEIVLRPGDLLLLHGPAEGLELVADQPGVLPLGEIPAPVTERARAVVAVLIMVGVVTVASLGLAPILSAALTGVVLMLFTRCVRPEEIHRELDWTVVFLLAGLLPLGLAMESSGAADWLVGGMAGVLEPLPAPAVVAGCYLVTTVLTEVMSNNAAAVVLTPVALALAERIDANPYALLVAVMFGASASFMTPTGYQTNTMVYGPGGYRFTDYLRVGGPLNLILLVVSSVVIPLLWP